MNGTHPDPERLVLAALPAEPADADVQAHLRGCARCRAEVADLQGIVELAVEDVGDLPTPPERLWLGIAAELGLPGEHTGNGHVEPTGPLAHLSAGPPPATAAPGGMPDLGADAGAEPAEGADPPPPGRHRAGSERTVAERPAAGRAGSERVRSERSGPGRGPRRHRVRRIVLPLVAAVVGVVVGLGIGRAWMPAAPRPEPVVQLASVSELDPGATGTVAMAQSGGERQMVVRVEGVTNLAGGDHLEAWLMDDSGTKLVPLGPLDGANGDFHGTFALPNGVPLGEFGRVDVSTEQWDGNPAHSSKSLLRADLPVS